MAIKERLLKQLNIVWDGLNAMPPFHSRDLNTMRNALVRARDLCFQGLPSGRFGDYQDTYDGLLLAVNQLIAGAADSQEIASLCDELLQHLSAQTQKETAFKKEIFFLPYKASMWDSLESVWRAAADDVEHCIAYVMPIPYADLTPEHTVAEWHYEKEMFPKDVPTVNWEDVDLQEIHPDAIFIHNPYDNYNRVTSVESRYYSPKLKECTDMLVYIPYYILGKIDLNNAKIMEWVSGFALCSSVLNADVTIVQSEVVRQAYVKSLTQYTDQKDEEFWKKRILGIGSPKIDKVMCVKREDYVLPKKWRTRIKGKTVVLYNTSLGDFLLSDEEKALNKWKITIKKFSERSDVILWWRPHPLMKATIDSMRPQISRKYDELINDYKESSIGIYDDSAELDRAIVWSDAYYGDRGSVLHLYEKTGKPMLIQDYSTED